MLIRPPWFLRISIQARTPGWRGGVSTWSGSQRGRRPLPSLSSTKPLPVGVPSQTSGSHNARGICILTRAPCWTLCSPHRKPGRRNAPLGLLELSGDLSPQPRFVHLRNSSSERCGVPAPRPGQLGGHTYPRANLCQFESEGAAEEPRRIFQIFHDHLHRHLSVDPSLQSVSTSFSFKTSKRTSKKS